MDTAGKVIKCKAAVTWEPQKPLSIEEIEVDPPGPHEVRIQIVASGVCRSDSYYLSGKDPKIQYPIILGHEGAGIVESVGEGVTSVKPGDKVIPLWMPQCSKCESCLSPETNLCTKNLLPFKKGFAPEAVSKFRCKGKQLHQFVGISTFSQYTIVADYAVAKISDAAPLNKVCLIGCCIATGYGASLNTAKVKPGSTCAIFGLGGVGLAAVMGCKVAGASHIFAIDIEESKFKIAKELGATKCLNPLRFQKPIHEVLLELTDGGVDCTIECIGNVEIMLSAVQACREGCGTAVIIGLAAPEQTIALPPIATLLGCTIKGSLFGASELLCCCKTLKAKDFEWHNVVIKGET
ncbi:alcohol dehydrogenase class-3-like [Protopterus annectens]|uniref:alcohol dehydrogenase class-3-like n=1 Tax=Protopterus annectens TaxID=7888 RepID=UPI001CFBEEFC|nr:alcohol dehydrogenase class-3-like [Protopterus annectens]